MSRLSAKLQSEPVGHTCPLIDSVIEEIKTYDDIDGRKAIMILEEIRNANSALRDWGSSLLEEYNELESEFRGKEYELQEALEELRGIEKTIKDFLKHK